MSASDKVWFYNSPDGQKGPHSAAELLGMKMTGEVSDADYVWREGLAGWQKLGETPELGGSGMVAIASMPSVAGTSAGGVHPAFDRDKFLLRQKLFTIGEKYAVWDEKGDPILYIERPAHLKKNLLATLAGIGTALLLGGAWGGVGFMFPDPVRSILIGIGAVLGIVVGAALGIFLSAKRHTTIYSDEAKSQRLVEIQQDQKWVLFVASFTVNDAAGKLLCRFKKNYLYDLFRKRWLVLDPDGSIWLIAKEDSILKSIIRRIPLPFFEFLRTNFIIVRSSNDETAGAFNRTFTLLDRYVLDMTADPERTIDRRIALALGVMLDSGERR